MKLKGCSRFHGYYNAVLISVNDTAGLIIAEWLETALEILQPGTGNIHDAGKCGIIAG